MTTYPTYKLGEIAEIILGQSPESKSYNTIGEGLPFFQGKTEFTDWFPIPNKWCTEPKKIAEPFDVLLSVRAPVGPTNIAKEKCCIGRGLAAIRYTDCYKYLLYYLRSVSKYLESKATGTTFSSISGDTIKNLPIPLPPLATQRAIVTRIETLFAELDKGVEKLKTAQQQLKVYRQAVLNDCLSKGSEKWKNVNIQYFLDKSSRGMITGPFGSALKKSEHQNFGVPVLGIENIGEGAFVMPNKIFVTEEKAKELKGFAVQSEDIIISRSGTVGEICKVPSFMNNALLSTNLIRVRLNLDVILADYFVLLFQCSQIKQQVKDLCKGTTRTFLNQTILNQIQFSLPSLPEQQRIVQEIETRLSQAELVEASVEQSLQQAEALRQSILKKAFSGELV